MTEPSRFLLEISSTVKFHGQEHTISSKVEPVFTGDETDAFDSLLGDHKRVHMVLAGIQDKDGDL